MNEAKEVNTAMGKPLTPAEKVEALLNPRSIAIIGASERPNNWAMRIHRNLLRYNFPGEVWPVNPKRDVIWDKPCYPSIDALPGVPDHVLVLAPAKAVPDTLRQAAAKGARSATIISAGFSELKDAASVALTEELERVINETGLAVSGPNCVGNINGFQPLMTNFEDRPTKIQPGPIALVSQSGGVGMLIKRLAEERCLDTGVMVTTGAELGLSVGDYIEYLADQPDIKVILCYLEGLRDAAGFLKSAQIAAEKGKPIVVLKVGASEAGRKASVAHTGALAGSLEAFDAAANRRGVTRADTMDEMIELAEYFANAKPAKGYRLGAMSTSGGKRGLIVDAADKEQLGFEPLAPESIRRLESVLGVGSDIGNPLDAGFAANVSAIAYETSVRSILEDPNVDIMMVEGELPRNDGSARREHYLRIVSDLAAEQDKPIVYLSVAAYGYSDYTREMRRTLPNVPFLQSSDRACKVIASGIRRAQWTAPGAPVVTGPGPNRAALHALLDQAGAGTLDEVAGKRVLELYGLPVPREGIATSADEAAKLAQDMGFPVVLKVVSPAIPHKSEAGGVLLNITDADAARAGYDQIMANVAAHAKPEEITGILVAEMVKGELELVLGAHDDPEMGAMLFAGSGGVAIELYKDYAMAPADISRAEAEAVIDGARVGRLVDGYRGSPALDRGAIADGLLAIAQMMVDAEGRLSSVEINPFTLNEVGGACLDALIVVKS